MLKKYLYKYSYIYEYKGHLNKKKRNILSYYVKNYLSELFKNLGESKFNEIYVLSQNVKVQFTYD